MSFRFDMKGCWMLENALPVATVAIILMNTLFLIYKFMASVYLQLRILHVTYLHVQPFSNISSKNIAPAPDSS